jgi:hypothetical protein
LGSACGGCGWSDAQPQPVRVGRVGRLRQNEAEEVQIRAVVSSKPSDAWNAETGEKSSSRKKPTDASALAGGKMFEDAEAGNDVDRSTHAEVGRDEVQSVGVELALDADDVAGRVDFRA